ncbi:MAG: xanthan lyase [Paludibacteraceae bacterium]|nr:xanthan lyase [Paludibacteraceae bacterium]
MIKKISFILLFLSSILLLSAQNYKQQVEDTLLYFARNSRVWGNFKVDRIRISGNTYKVELGEMFNSIHYRPELVDSMEQAVKAVIKPKYNGYNVQLCVHKKNNIRDLVPNYYRAKSDIDHSRYNTKYTETIPFVRNEDRAYEVKHGLQDRNIALWQSHGWYYEQRTDRWQWQRARVFTTVEDKFTLSFVIPYLAPMLERAGANVFMPRERDYQRNEVIVDNDKFTIHNSQFTILSPSNQRLSVHNAQLRKPGFAHNQEVYHEHENPFKAGTYEMLKADKKESATVCWTPEIPEDGWYWVSVAYQTDKKSVPDAKYTVRHSAGETTFRVNQQMGGGTWTYLGQFYFRKGADAEHASVVLSNESDHKGVVVADAVRFGGGMGNVARRPATDEEIARLEDEKDRERKISIFEKEEYETSGRARFWEASRYWLQWAGAPDSVISYTKGLNDYTDDYTCRAQWVNWLNQGSVNAPDSVGLGIPIDLSFAFHSDAGCKLDTVIGTLCIYTTPFDVNEKEYKYDFPSGQSRFASRDLTDFVMSQIVGDVCATANPNWTQRWMWDRSYSESRRPEVPAMLLELLSHQNFEDMSYGLDPRFKFIVSRAIYKAMTKFIATQNNEDYVIAPLPINSFALRLIGDNKVRLSWRPTIDSLESTAVADKYVVYTRRDGEGWDNGVLVDDTVAVLPIGIDEMMSYKVVAVNDGGASMDSEILSAYSARNAKGEVLVINGFDRVAGPEGFQSAPYAGFPEWLDRGVGDGVELQYVGRQHDFDSRRPWISDDDSGWGQSNSDYEQMLVAGNTHDFPFVHGSAIVKAGYSFVSCSRSAVECGDVDIADYKLVDLILGEQKETLWRCDSSACEYRTFSVNLQRELRRYVAKGGALFVSGAYVASDNWLSVNATKADQKFVKEVLHVEWRADRATQDGELKAVYAPNAQFTGNYQFVQHLNEEIYAVESPDAIVPFGENAYTVMRYSQNNNSATVAYSGEDYRVVVCGFPFETLASEAMQQQFMQQIIDFLTK